MAFCKVISYYSLSDEQVLKMPVTRFWCMLKNIDRLRAEDDIHSLTNIYVATGSPNEKGYEQMHKKLTDQLGDICKFDQPQETDRKGWNRMKMLSGK